VSHPRALTYGFGMVRRQFLNTHPENLALEVNCARIVTLLKSLECTTLQFAHSLLRRRVPSRVPRRAQDRRGSRIAPRSASQTKCRNTVTPPRRQEYGLAATSKRASDCTVLTISRPSAEQMFPWSPEYQGVMTRILVQVPASVHELASVWVADIDERRPEVGLRITLPQFLSGLV